MIRKAKAGRESNKHARRGVCILRQPVDKRSDSSEAKFIRKGIAIVPSTPPVSHLTRRATLNAQTFFATEER